jgi:hypothetical protein
MSYAVDSNILLRIAQDNHPMHAAATSAVAALFRQGEVIHVLPQNLYEFWVVAARPADKNGLGLPAAAAGAELARMKRLFQFAADTSNRGRLNGNFGSKVGHFLLLPRLPCGAILRRVIK